MTTLAAASDASMNLEKRFYPIYLIYSAFYFFPLLFMGPYLDQKGFGWWLAMYAQFAAFIGLYLVAGYYPKFARLAIGAMLGLATVGCLVTVGTSAFFPYVFFLALFMFPMREARFWVAAASVGILIGCVLTDWVWYFWGPAVMASAFNAVFALVESKKRDAVSQAEALNRIQERERIARDLHDVTGHQLTAIGLKAQLAKKLIDAERIEEAKIELEGIAELAATNRTAIRSVIEGELPNNCRAVFDELTGLLKAQGFEVTEHGQLPEIAPNYAAEVSAIIGESLTNVLRHAEETKVAMSHSLSAEGYLLCVTNKAKANNAARLGSGLKNLAHRAEGLGGSASFEISPEGNAVTRIQLPSKVLVSQ